MKRWSTKALLVTAAVSAAADQAYLPVSGPAPLRFSHPVVHKAPTLVLPPLAIIDPRPPEPSVPAPTTAVVSNTPPTAAHAPVAPEPGASTAPNSGVPSISEPIVPPPQFSPVVTNGVEFVRPDTENLTPQMFMKFFTGRPGTNSSGLTIIAPLPFVPPAPPAPSSTATYTTPSKP